MKFAIYSKTLQGVVVMLLPIVARAFGLDLGDADVTELAEAVVSLIGAGWATYGRLAATQRLTVKPK